MTVPAPINKPLWRSNRADRRRQLEPFRGERVQIEVWPTRVASDGDRIYRGTLVTVAVTTTGTNADLAIIATPDGTTWAVSTAQIAHIHCTA